MTEIELFGGINGVVIRGGDACNWFGGDFPVKTYTLKWVTIVFLQRKLTSNSFLIFRLIWVHIYNHPLFALLLFGLCLWYSLFLWVGRRHDPVLKVTDKEGAWSTSTWSTICNVYSTRVWKWNSRRNRSWIKLVVDWTRTSQCRLKNTHWRQWGWFDSSSLDHWSGNDK